MKDALDLVVVHTIQGELSGHLIRTHLESAGIPAMLKTEAYFRVYMGLLSPVNILVPRKYSGEAKKIIFGTEGYLKTKAPNRVFWWFVVLLLLSKIGPG